MKNKKTVPAKHDSLSPVVLIRYLQVITPAHHVDNLRYVILYAIFAAFDVLSARTNF